MCKQTHIIKLVSSKTILKTVTTSNTIKYCYNVVFLFRFQVIPVITDKILFSLLRLQSSVYLYFYILTRNSNPLKLEKNELILKLVDSLNTQILCFFLKITYKRSRFFPIRPRKKPTNLFDRFFLFIKVHSNLKIASADFDDFKN